MRSAPVEVRFDHFDAEDERRRTSLLALGNGVLSLRPAAPEASREAPAVDDAHYAGFYHAGWYDDAPRLVNGRVTDVAALVNLPQPFGLSLRLNGGTWFSPAQAHRRYEQSLKMEDGIVERQMTFELDGHAVSLCETWLVDMADGAFAAVGWTIRLPEGVEHCDIQTGLDARVANAAIPRSGPYEGQRLQDIEVETHGSGEASASAALHDRAFHMAMAMRARVTPDAQLLGTESGPDHVRFVLRCCRPADGLVRIDVTAAVAVDEALRSGGKEARETVRCRLPVEAFESLRARHGAAWASLWQRMPLHVEPQWERPLRLHAFHLLQAASPHSARLDVGLPPKGWQEGYYGQVFWDEIFAFPFLATRFPEIARGLLRYRHRRLPAAREHAAAAGLRGAMFPWRSGRTGLEETPPYQFNPLSGKWMPDHTYLQRHIGAAIAYDAWTVFLATDDLDVLANEAGELILEIARFWASVATFDSSKARYVITGVIGPDEYHNAYPGAAEPGLDNNAYTNVMAVWTICRGFDVLAALPDGGQALCARLGIDEQELAQWEDVSRRMYVPLLSDGVVEQFDGFDRLQPPNPAWLEDGRPRLDWWLNAKGDSCDRYQLTKQADVLMLAYLFTPHELEALFARLGYVLDDDAARRTVEYYMARITHESSLSTVVCAGALARIDPAASWACFRECLDVDLAAPPEGGTREGIHLGAMAGSLDVLQRHYCGLYLCADGLHLDPAPPAALGDVRFELRFRGALLHVHLGGERLRLSVQEGSARAIEVNCRGDRQTLQPGGVLDIRCTRGG
ncbi:glycosyl hydrolase family 65 protein [Pseudomonas sp. Marseille-QA0892]